MNNKIKDIENLESMVNKKEVFQNLQHETEPPESQYGFEYYTLNNSKHEAGHVTHIIDFIWHSIKPGLKLIASGVIVSSLLNISGLVSFYDQIRRIHTESFTNTLIVLMSLYLMGQIMKGTLAIVRKDRLTEEKMTTLPFTISLALIVFMLLPIFDRGSLFIQVLSSLIDKFI